jgi:hypothetical protein
MRPADVRQPVAKHIRKCRAALTGEPFQLAPLSRADPQRYETCAAVACIEYGRRCVHVYDNPYDLL